MRFLQNPSKKHLAMSVHRHGGEPCAGHGNPDGGSQQKQSLIAAAPLTYLVNLAAFIGWSLVAVRTMYVWNDAGKPTDSLLWFTFYCECISASEMVKIALGMMRGDLVLGLTVHYTR